MKQSFPSIVDVNFTANMEGLLDKVAEGKVDWKTVIENFYPDLDEAVKDSGEGAGESKDRGRGDGCDLRGVRPQHGHQVRPPREIPGLSRDFRNAAIPSPIWKRSASPARSAARRWCSARPRRAESTTAARTIRSAILCPGRSLREEMSEVRRLYGRKGK